jgi:hypothetical protein
MDISFSERLSNLLAMQNLLRLDGPSGQLEAKQLEDSAYDRANSKVRDQSRT